MLEVWQANEQDIDAINLTTGAAVSSSFIGLFPGSYREWAGFTDLTVHFTDRFDIQFGGRESRLFSLPGKSPPLVGAI